MAVVKQLDKRSGITYIYESQSVWDKERKQSRSVRRLIGSLDAKTGEIIATDGRRREERRAARIAKQEAKDNALLQKYIEYYTKKKEREDRKRQAAASSVSAAEAEGGKSSTGIATATGEASLPALTGE